MKQVYADPDQAIVRLVATKLEQRGIRVFVQTRDPMVSGISSAIELTTLYVRDDADAPEAEKIVARFLAPRPDDDDAPES